MRSRSLLSLLAVVATAVAICSWMLSSRSEPVEVPAGIRDSAPMESAGSPVTAGVEKLAAEPRPIPDAAPSAQLGQPVVAPQSRSSFQASAIVGSQVSTAVAEEVAAAVDGYWTIHQVLLNRMPDHDQVHAGTYFFSVWPVLGELVQQGRVPIRVVQRKQALVTTSGSINWTINHGKREMVASIDTASFQVLLTFTKDSIASSLFDEVFDKGQHLIPGTSKPK